MTPAPDRDKAKHHNGSWFDAGLMKLGLENKFNQFVPFRVARASTLLLGKPGTGKSETLLRYILNDIYAGKSLVLLDPTGHLTQQVLDHIPLNRVRDVLLFQPDLFTFPFNVLSDVPEEKHATFSSLIVESIAKLWPSDIITTRINNYVGYSLRTLLPVPKTTLFSIVDLLSDKSYRTCLLPVKDISINSFWELYDVMTPKEQRDKTESTLTRILSFMLEPIVRDSIGHKHNNLSFRNKIVLLPFRESEIGTDNTKLLGGLALAQLALEGLDGLSTTLYVDGADRFPGVSIILKRCPSIPVFLTVQFLTQLGREKDTVLGSVRHTLAFRTTMKDAKELEPEFYLGTQDHLYEQADYHAYLPQGSHSVKLYMPMHGRKKTNQAHEIVKWCRKHYGG